MRARTEPIRRVAFAAAASALLLAGCGEKSKKKPAALPAPSVTLATIGKQTVPITMRFSGVVKPIKEVEVIPRVDGFIEKRSFVEGSEIPKGTEMYLIDPRTYEATLESAKAQLQKDQASLTLYTAELKRFEQAGTAGAVSQEQVDQTRAMEREAAAAVEADKAAVQSAELDLEFTKVTAPFDGRAGQTRQDLGELVTAYSSVLTMLTQMDPIYVLFNLSRADLFQIETLMEQGVAKGSVDDFVVKVKLPDGTPYEKDGKFNFLAPEIDPTTDTLAVRAIFDNAKTVSGSRTLLPGQFVPLTLTVGEREAVLVPQTAIVQNQAGFQVMLVDDKNVATARTITLGREVGAMRIVESGLKVGDKVVSQGVLKVKPGKKVDPKPASAAPKPAS